MLAAVAAPAKDRLKPFTKFSKQTNAGENQPISDVFSWGLVLVNRLDVASRLEADQTSDNCGLS